VVASPVSLTISGAVTFTGIGPGSYYIEETTVPAGYTKMANITGIVVGNDGVVAMPTVPNPVTNIHLGTVTLNKTFVHLVTSANFYLLGDDGYYYTSTGEAKNAKADAIRTINSNGAISWSGLPWQGYSIEEDSIAGYISNINPSTFTIDATTEDQLVTVTATNTQIPGTIQINKTDASDPSIKLQGAVFRLFNSDGTTRAKDMGGTVDVPDAITDINGKADFINLAWGNFIVREIVAPAGYTGAADQTVAIDANNAEAGISLTFVNTPPTITRLGTIEIQKDPAVSGVGFTLYASDGTTIVAGEKFTDGTGKVTFGSLPYGTYIVRETKGIPRYSLAADQTVVIDSTTVASVISLTFTNTPATVTVTGGGITVAGITTPGITPGIIQILAFTGLDPIIPISGGSAVIGGLAMLLATLRRKRNKK
jgi:uncharacterized surface anchored protein